MKPTLPQVCTRYEIRNSVYHLPNARHTFAEQSLKDTQGRPQDLGGGGAKNFFFQIWEFECREATCCAWRSHAHC